GSAANASRHARPTLMATSLVAVPMRPRPGGAKWTPTLAAPPLRSPSGGSIRALGRPGGAKWTPRINVRSSRLREHRIVAVRFRSQCTGQILERREIVYGQEIIDVRQHGTDAGGTRLESGIA